jgi:hypothetical protein
MKLNAEEFRCHPALQSYFADTIHGGRVFSKTVFFFFMAKWESAEDTSRIRLPPQEIGFHN